jgi:hypothetical protein
MFTGYPVNRCGGGPRMPNDQAPMTNQTTNGNAQGLLRSETPGYQALLFQWSLVLGHWAFEEQKMPQDSIKPRSYPWLMHSTGQTSAQAPQSVHLAASIAYLVSA